jgi:hypothetical protein
MYDASQFGQLNRLTGDFGIADFRRIFRTHKSPFYLQAAREQPLTLALLPVESCELL